MSRLNDIVQKIEQKCPNDWWIMADKKHVQEDHRFNPQYKKIKIEYNKALDCLDPESFSILKNKICMNFKGEKEQKSDGRGKHQMFDLMNEAFAYEFLLNRRAENVTFLQEKNKNKKPDIKFEQCGSVGYCEVKTIHISDKQLEFYKNQESIDNLIAYERLNEQFFKKLSNTLSTAQNQLKSTNRIDHFFIYLIIHFDDFTLEFYQTHEKQIIDFFEQNHPDIEIYVRVGIFEDRKIHHAPI